MLKKVIFTLVLAIVLQSCVPFIAGAAIGGVDFLDDFEVVGYQCHEPIAYPFSV